ncbi:hypothetical protein DFP72DRAFT_122940 [Ephemerocybe angulata]|uniref:Uncharacterized protein n=1 Tax=Ephemerocybe angulata TaxID=980116 RepID=A0A8H6LUY6_9AGAR|nr:hypothetical protein DFP72DRAFT_122940 [Tulosesus angulatus]
MPISIWIVVRVAHWNLSECYGCVILLSQLPAAYMCGRCALSRTAPSCVMGAVPSSGWSAREGWRTAIEWGYGLYFEFGEQARRVHSLFEIINGTYRGLKNLLQTAKLFARLTLKPLDNSQLVT